MRASSSNIPKKIIKLVKAMLPPIGVMSSTSTRGQRDDEDISILSRIIAGEENALGELYDRYERPLFSLIWRVLGTAEDAEDVTQDVFMNVWNAAETYQKTDGTVFSWLMMLTRKRAADRARSNEDDDDDDGPGELIVMKLIEDVPDTNPYANSILDELWKMTKDATANIPLDQQQAIAMAYYKGYTQSKIAELLEVSTGIVTWRIWNGMSEMRSTLKERLQPLLKHDEKYPELCPTYVLGALDGDELRDLEAHLAHGCDVCATEITALNMVAGTIPILLPQRVPPPELKERVLYAARFSEAVKQGAQKGGEERVGTGSGISGHRSWLTYGLAIAAIMMVVAFSASYISLLDVLGQKNRDLASQSMRIVELTNELQRKEEILSVLASRRINIVVMDGLPVNPVGFGKIIWDPDKKVAILQVSCLPPVPTEKDYQLWVIKGKDPQHPVSAGVFVVTNTEESYFKVQPLAVADRSEIGAFAVTLEPKGGVLSPTGEMYLLGKPVSN